jgi:hypothetical protein
MEQANKCQIDTQGFSFFEPLEELAAQAGRGWLEQENFVNDELSKCRQARANWV